jgi:hypothetical protein
MIEAVQFTGETKLKRGRLPNPACHLAVSKLWRMEKQQQSRTNRNRPAPDGLYTLEIEGIFELDRSSWIAARVADDPDSENRILPRGLTVFAHTNPIFFLQDRAKVRDLSSIRYLQKYLKGTIHWLNTGARFESPAEMEEALRWPNRLKALEKQEGNYALRSKEGMYQDGVSMSYFLV